MQTISEKVDVVLASSNPISMHWRNKDYRITKVGLRHNFYEGNDLIHIFSVLSGSLFLKLKLNTKTLSWTLLEVLENEF